MFGALHVWRVGSSPWHRESDLLRNLLRVKIFSKLGGRGLWKCKVLHPVPFLSSHNRWSHLCLLQLEIVLPGKFSIIFYFHSESDLHSNRQSVSSFVMSLLLPFPLHARVASLLTIKCKTEMQRVLCPISPRQDVKKLCTKSVLCCSNEWHIH